MKTLKRESILAIGVIFSLLLLILKTVFIGQSFLIDDEAYYAVWARHLGPGYIEHGPGTAWFIRLTSSIFGDNGFGIRIGGLLSFLLLSYLGYRFFVRNRDEIAGWSWVILIHLTPFFFGVSFIITPDTPMLFFLFLTVFAYHQGIFENRRYYWLGGIFLGLATLSKIPAAFVGLAILGYHFLSKDRKRLLVRFEMWGSFFVSLLIYSPFLIWNALHDWPFVRFVFSILNKPGSTKSMVELWIAQAGLYLPTLFFPMVALTFYACWGYLKKKKKEEAIFFSLISMVPTLYLIYKSSQNKLEANWPAIAFIGGFLLVIDQIGRHWKKIWVRRIFFIHSFMALSATALVLTHALFSYLPIKAKIDITNRYHIAKPFKVEFKTFYHTKMDKDIRIIAMNYQIPSFINIYVKPKLEAICIDLGDYHPTAYDLWHKKEDNLGKDFYYIYSGRQANQKMLDLFEKVVHLKTFSSFRDGIKIMDYTLLLGKNYKGNQPFQP